MAIQPVKTINKTFSAENFPTFFKKYGHLVDESSSTSHFLEQTSAQLLNSVKTRKEYIIPDIDYFERDNPILLFINSGLRFGEISHMCAVKAFAKNIFKGKVKITEVNTGMLKEESYIGKYGESTLAKTKTELKKILKKVLKTNNIAGVNLAISPEISLARLNKIGLKDLNENTIFNLYKKEYPWNSDKKALNEIEILKTIASLADNDVLVTIASGNERHTIAFNSLAKYLSNKPDNIKIIGAKHLNGNKIKRFYNYERFIDDWTIGKGRFLPIIHNNKILGLTLEGSHDVSIRINKLDTDTRNRIRLSNLFSGLTLEKAKEKASKLGSKQEYKFFKTSDGVIRLCNGKDMEEFTIENGKLVSKILKELNNTNLISGTSFSSPTKGAKEVMQRLNLNY